MAERSVRIFEGIGTMYGPMAGDPPYEFAVEDVLGYSPMPKVFRELEFWVKKHDHQDCVPWPELYLGYFWPRSWLVDSSLIADSWDRWDWGQTCKVVNEHMCSYRDEHGICRIPRVKFRVTVETELIEA